MWEIDPENGAYIRGMRPGVTTSGAFFANYTLEFEAKINKGGVGWVVVRSSSTSQLESTMLTDI